MRCESALQVDQCNITLSHAICATDYQLAAIYSLRDRKNADTELWRQILLSSDHVPQTLGRFATHATFVCDTNFLSWTHKMFREIFRNISVSCVRRRATMLSRLVPRTGNIALDTQYVADKTCRRFAGALHDQRTP